MRITTFLATLILAPCALVAQQKGYYRTPAIYKNTVVFTAEGDLWKYDLATGNTARLTTHEGMETSPLISPDGKTVEFDFLDVSGSTQRGMMNHAAFTVIDANHHTEGWAYMLPGNQTFSAHADFTRTK